MRSGAPQSPSMLAKIVTLFVALTGFAGSCLAASAPLCSEIFTTETSSQGRVTKLLDVGSSLRAQNFEDHLNSIDQLLGSLDRPLETQVTVGSQFSNSVFDRITFKLYVGLRSDLPESDKSTSQEKNLAGLSHEYGHAILEKNFLTHSEAYRNFKGDYVAAAPGKKTERIQKIYFISSALHEFFADVITVVRHKDPQAIKYVMKNYKTDAEIGSWEDLNYRDFNPPEKQLFAENWEKFLPWATYTADAYHTLLPARWEVWNLMKPHLDSPNAQAQVLAKVYKAVEKVLEEAIAWDSSQIQGAKLQPEQMKLLNRRLIEELHHSLE